MRGVGVILRRFIGSRAPCMAAISENLILSSSAAAASYSTLILAEESNRPLFNSAIAVGTIAGFQPGPLNHFRGFSSSSSSGSSKVVSIESEEQFTNSLRRIQDESLPAIFYFTAVWCGPCRLLSPIIGELIEKYPHVTTYKIDIDKEGLGDVLSKQNINSVPTLHFFQNGKKAEEVVGADVERLKNIMDSLYK